MDPQALDNFLFYFSFASQMLDNTEEVHLFRKSCCYIYEKRMQSKV